MSDYINALIGDYGPAITLIVLITISLIGILRLGIKFDINQFLTARKKRHLALARQYCPHIRLIPKNDGIQIQPLFYSPHGTTDWICRQCGIVVNIAPGDEEIQDEAHYFFNHPEEYTKRLKRFQKHMRKAL
ncbi:hypothetical protein [Enorma massiliensis]|uniref:hypothetical protein n=1 Tax=Enorma massiliensis TaxID=1472761 RepID=UPI00320A9A61